MCLVYEKLLRYTDLVSDTFFEMKLEIELDPILMGFWFGQGTS